MRLAVCLLVFVVALSGRLVWDSEVELSQQNPRHDIHVSGDGLVVLHDRLGHERRVRFVDGKLSSPSCSPYRAFGGTETLNTHTLTDSPTIILGDGTGTYSAISGDMIIDTEVDTSEIPLCSDLSPGEHGDTRACVETLESE